MGNGQWAMGNEVNTLFYLEGYFIFNCSLFIANCTLLIVNCSLYIAT